ncbi:MAG: tRNA (adenosine(37)-N6)-threonylcarbamoyltransferase complex transferase subunit TsaD [Bradymonadales bacterium]|nr:MAG: tRNA (adenosine(37)-N6)-threonylcarbamoyltransferase complex transferase subunit TsaD [Bradymonadales bacterium]
MSDRIKILAFETSCDDTSVAALEANPGDRIPRLLSLAVQSQDEVHLKYGGVVPELASRAHLRSLLPLMRKVITETGWDLAEVQAFAATSQPGLVGSLLVGQTAAKSLSFLYPGRFISCHHLESHLLSVFLEEDQPDFPFLAALVSGGHTSLYRVDGFDQFHLLGGTRDDAMGEAFDKAAKCLGLGFPGGAKLEELARAGDPTRFKFSAVKVDGLEFSFSGLKSQLARFAAKHSDPESRPHLAAGFQKALMDHLIEKIKRAAEESALTRLVVVGGVARNLELKSRCQNLLESGVLERIFVPRMEFCTDNAAMVGVRAYVKFLQSEFSDFEEGVSSTSRPAIRRKTQ